MLTFALKECCLLLLCATVVIAATLAHLGLFSIVYISLYKFCGYFLINISPNWIQLLYDITIDLDKTMHINHILCLQKINGQSMVCYTTGISSLNKFNFSWVCVNREWFNLHHQHLLYFRFTAFSE